MSQAAELRMDEVLRIHTTGRDESNADLDHNPYEPTPYAVLDRLANSGLIGKRNVLVDYGCGKGRVGFYLSYQLRCKSIGVEYDEWLYVGALRNAEKGAAAARVSFVQVDAARYVPPCEADRFYFFNPFSVEIFAQVLEGVHASLVAHPREALLILYYPADEYMALVANVPWLSVEGEIDCRDLFDGEDPREKLVILRAAV